MNLQNDYRVVYEKVSGDKRAFYASKTGLFADAELITEIDLDKYNLIYEKAGKLYGSETNVPTENDYYFKDFEKIFTDGEEEVHTEPVSPAKEDDKASSTEVVNEVDPEDTQDEEDEEEEEEEE